LTIDQSQQRIALFPLHTVLFPGCTLPLQIFEQRYLRLVKNAIQHETGFAVVLISAGKEVGDSPEVFTTGCYVEIIDWETLPNGLLGVTIEARHRVQVTSPCAQHDGLLMADCSDLGEDTGFSHETLLGEYTDLVDTLKHLEHHPFVAAQGLQFDYTNCQDVSNKLAYLLPVSSLNKQTLLEIIPVEQRMQALREVIQQLQNLA
jgi:Lon protease-like protein